MNSTVSALAKLLKGKVREDDGLIVAGKETYVELRPEGVTEEQLDKVNQYNTDYLAASALVTGELAHASPHDTVNGAFEGGDHIGFEHLFQRKVTIEGEERHNYMTSAIMNDFGTSKDGIAAVHSHIAQLITSEETVAEEE